MARAQALLALTATPRSMPCRDNERAAITSFVEESLTAGDLLTHSAFGFPSWLSPLHLYWNALLVQQRYTHTHQAE